MLRGSARRQWRWSLVSGILLLAGLGVSGASAFEDSEVSAIVGNLKQPADFPGAGGVWMARQHRIEIDGVGNSQIVEHLIARVFDPAWGEARFGPYRRTYWSEFTGLLVERARIWHSRTEFTELPASAISDSIAPAARGVPSCHYLHERQVRFPHLDQGDVIELLLRWGSPIPPYDLNVRWFEQTLEAEDPVVEQQFVLVTPPGSSAQVRILGPVLPRQTSRESGMVKQVWLTGNLPAASSPLIETPWSRVPQETDSVSAGITRILFSTVRDWSYFSAYFGKQWEEAWNRRDASMDRIVAGVSSQHQEPGDRARALESYVQSQVRTLAVPAVRLGLWPLEAGAVARDGAGSPRDKACLLVSLLRQSGVNASPVLVRSRPGTWDATFPCLSQLDHFLVLARIPGKADLWLDPVGGAKGVRPSLGLIFNGSREGPQSGGQAGLVPTPEIPPSPR